MNANIYSLDYNIKGEKMKYYNKNKKELNIRKGYGKNSEKAFMAYQAGKYKVAVKLLESIPKNLQSANSLLTLANSYNKLGKTDKAKEVYERILDVNYEHPHVLYGLAKICINDGELEKAENLLYKVLEKEKSSERARCELGRIKIKQNKYVDAEILLNECLQINPNNVYARMDLAKIYAEKNLDKEAKAMYDYIYENMEIEEYTEEERERHVKKHWQDDLTKNKHGVFTMSFEEIRSKINFQEMYKQSVNMADIYCARVENCGYEGGARGDKHQLDYVTIVTLPFKTDIVTMFPSDKVIIEKEKMKLNDYNINEKDVKKGTYKEEDEGR